ncbi:tellurite resistance protein TehA [Pasteurellaceae bacterium Pebbles2]|nr:tellurite resistance protein TehA [Pasteurellaceae bacterium Pebbles2]
MSQAHIFPVPTSYFSIVLGLSATAMAWHHAEQIFPTIAASVSLSLGIVATVLWGLFALAFLIKCVKYPELVKAELNSPIQFAFVSLIPITAIIIGEFLLNFAPHFGRILIYIAIAAQLIYASWTGGALWKGTGYCEKAILPPFYLPTVAANFSSAGALGLLGYTDIGYLFLGAGTIAWLSFEPTILQRIRVSPLDTPLRATMGIILAPAFVCSAAYLTLNGGEVDLLVKILWGYGLLQMLFLIRLLPWFFSNGFVIGFWAFSFGLASLANSAVSFIHQYGEQPLGMLALGLFVFANLGIGLLITGTLVRFAQGKFFVK